MPLTQTARPRQDRTGRSRFRPAQPQPVFRRRHSWLAWNVGSALVAAAVFGIAGLRLPAGPATGTEFHPPRAATVFMGSLATAGLPPVADDTIRLATFNIHGGKGGRDNVCDLERTAACLRQFNLIGLNEVRSGVLAGNQAQILGDKLGLPWLSAPAESRWGSETFGNAALTSLEVTGWRRVPLPHVSAVGYRSLLELECRAAGKALHVIVTHLERGSATDREAQLKFIARRFFELQQPAVLMGDLNSDASEPAIAELLQGPGVVDPVEVALGDRAPRRIDWLLVRGLEPVAAGVESTAASDHPYVWATVRLAR